MAVSWPTVGSKSPLGSPLGLLLSVSGFEPSGALPGGFPGPSEGFGVFVVVFVLSGPDGFVVVPSGGLFPVSGLAGGVLVGCFVVVDVSTLVGGFVVVVVVVDDPPPRRPLTTGRSRGSTIGMEGRILSTMGRSRRPGSGLGSRSSRTLVANLLR